MDMLYVPFDIVRELTTEAFVESRSSPPWDPYLGNRLDTTWAKISGRETTVGLVAFPMGSLGQDLSAQSFCPLPTSPP